MIWLGEPEDKTSLEVMQSTLDRLDTTAVVADKETDIWEAVLQRSWFRRRWVIQEYALSSVKVFMIGDFLLSPSELVRCLWKAGVRGVSHGMSRLHELRDIKMLPEGTAMNRSILQRLHQFAQSENSHPLDCVYALHSISADRHALTIDYSDSMRQLNERIAMLYLNDWTTVLPLLISAQMWRHSDYPSWLPNCQYSAPAYKSGDSPPIDRLQPIFDKVCHAHASLRDDTRDRLHMFGQPSDAWEDQLGPPENVTSVSLQTHWQAPKINGDQLQLKAFIYLSLIHI